MDIFLMGEGWGGTDAFKSCIERGATVLGFVDDTQDATPRLGVPCTPAAEAVEHGFDRILVTHPRYEERQVPLLLALGVPPWRIIRLYPDPGEALALLGPVVNWACRTRGRLDHYRVAPFDGPFTEDTRASQSCDAALAQRLLRLFQDAHKGQVAQERIYHVGENWGRVLQATRKDLYDASRAGDPAALEQLLMNFWRNGLGAGIIGGERAFREFQQAPAEAVHAALHRSLEVLQRSSTEDLEPSDLGLPPFGNPFGALLEGHLVQENALINLHRSRMIARLLEGTPRPVVAEIGGGAGYLPYYLLKHLPETVYLDFDLPENLVVAAYLLSLAFPKRRILYYDYSIETLECDLLDRYDIILMPNYMLPRLGADTVDLFLNTISFGEMSLAAVNAYLLEAERVTRRFLYQENLAEPCFDFENYPLDRFEMPASFRRIFSAPSRWPFFSFDSVQHAFTENLYLKRGQRL